MHTRKARRLVTKLFIVTMVALYAASCTMAIYAMRDYF